MPENAAKAMLITPAIIRVVESLKWFGHLASFNLSYSRKSMASVKPTLMLRRL